MKKIKIILSIAIISVLACPGPPPNFASEEEAIGELRDFFADILDPLPQIQRNKTVPFKYSCFAHPRALWLIINKPDMLQKAQIPRDVIQAIEFDTSSIVGSSVESLVSAMENYVPESFYIDKQTSIDTALDEFDLSSIGAINNLENIKVPKIGEHFTAFLKSILKNYFPSLQLQDKKRVLASYLRNTSASSSKAEVLLSLIYASGPFFQKYIQLLGDYLDAGNDPELNELKRGLDNIKSGLLPLDPYYVQQYVEEIKSKGADIEIEKSLGAASVGETFLVKMTKKDVNAQIVTQQIVVKLRRPEIETIAAREVEFFQGIARSISPTIEISFNELKNQIYEEMDYTLELAKLEKGVAAYDTLSSPIRVAKPIDDFPKSKYWMAMELAPGKTFSSVHITAPPLDPNKAMVARVEMIAKGALLEALIEKFTQKAFFLQPDGFFHGDLHEGNLLLHIDDSVYDILRNKTGGDINLITADDIKLLMKKTKADGNNFIQLTIIDFGNAHSITKKARQGLLNLLLSAVQASRSPSAFLRAYNEIAEVKIDESDFSILEKELVAKRFYTDSDDYRTPYARLGDGIDVLINNGYPVPSVVTAFSRTLAMIDNAFSQWRKEGKAAFGKNFVDFSMEDAIEGSTVCPVLASILPESWVLNILSLLSRKTPKACKAADICPSRENLNALINTVEQLIGAPQRSVSVPTWIFVNISTPLHLLKYFVCSG